jgi:hypothetical protein
MRTNLLLTLEFVSNDTEGRGTPLPAAQSSHWDRLLGIAGLSDAQLEESCACYELSLRCQVGRTHAGVFAVCAWCGRSWAPLFGGGDLGRTAPLLRLGTKPAASPARAGWMV